MCASPETVIQKRGDVKPVIGYRTYCASLTTFLLIPHKYANDQMTTADKSPTPDWSEITLQVENIGGITSASVSFAPGVTILTGANATNRTSLLHAFNAGLGGSMATVKTDAAQGHVKLDVGSDAFTRTVSEVSTTDAPQVIADGLSGAAIGGDDVGEYIDSGAVVDLFVTLTGQNPVRNAVVTGDGNLRSVIMEPLDDTRIQSKLQTLQRDRSDLQDEITALETDLQSLSEVRDRRESLETDLSDVTADLEAVEDDIETLRARRREAVETDDEQDDVAEQIDDVMEELDEKREEKSAIENEITTQQNVLENHRDSLDELRTNRQDLESEEPRDLQSIDAEIDRLKRQRRTIKTAHDLLTDVRAINTSLLDSPEAVSMVVNEETENADHLTDALSASERAETVDCWTCGSTITRDEIDRRNEELGAVAGDLYSQMEDLSTRIEDLEREKRDEKRRRERRETIATKIDSVEDRIRELEDEIERLQDDRENVDEHIADLEADLNDLREQAAARRDADADGRDVEISEIDARLDDLTEQKASLAARKASLETTLENVRGEIETLEEKRERLTEKQKRVNDVEETIEDLRGRVAEIESDTIRLFNQHMAQVLDELDYGNIERVWLERIFDNAAENVADAFELHIVREGDDGVVYEDTVDTLSESEREVIGLVVGIAGYLAYDVGRAIPVLLLDSLEAIDADRIAALLAYVAEHTEYTVGALLPEDAETLPADYSRIEAPIEDSPPQTA